MNNTTRPHQGYVGSIDVDLDAGQLYGRVLYVQDLVTFTAESVGSLQLAFQEAVDDYLETCAQVGKAPDKPFSGTFQIRITSDLHRALACEAASSGKSLNELVTGRLSASVSAPANVNVSFVANVNVSNIIEGTSTQLMTALPAVAIASSPSHDPAATKH